MPKSREEQDYPSEDHAPQNNQAEDYPEEEEHAGNAAPHEEEASSNDDSSDEESLTPSEQDKKDLEEDKGADIRACPSEHCGYYATVFYIVAAAISFVFMLTASCPVPWLAAGNGDKWTIWKDNTGTQWKNVACEHKAQMFQAMQAFSIVGCVGALACFITGILQVVGKGHLGVTLFMGVAEAIVLLTDWSLITNQYHKYNCPGEISYVNHINRLNAGFALTICSFGLFFFALVALGYHMYLTFALPELHRESYRGGALLSALVTGAVTTIACVASATTLYQNYYPGNFTVKVTMWHVEIYNRANGLWQTWPVTGYNCKAFTNLLRAGAAFSIISDAFLFLTFLLSLAAVYNRACKWAALGLGVCSWVFLLISWAILVAIRYKTFCPNGASSSYDNMISVPFNDGTEQRVYFEGYVIAEGLGMILSSFAIMTLNIIYLGVRG